MSELKTYSLVGDPHEAGMEEDGDLGQWVRVEDVEPLKSCIEAMERIIKKGHAHTQEDTGTLTIYWDELNSDEADLISDILTQKGGQDEMV